MNMRFKTLTSASLAGALLLAGQAFANSCPTAPATGHQTYGSPVCIATYGQDGPGTGLQDFFNNIVVSGTVPNVYTDQVVPSSFWAISASSGSYNEILLEIAGNAALNSYGIFDPTNPANSLQLFSGPASKGYYTLLKNNGGGSYTAQYFDAANTYLGSSTVTFGTANEFGYYLSGPGGTFYSFAGANETSSYYPNGTPHMVAYQGNGSTLNDPGVIQGTFDSGEYIMAWEDTQYSASDLDYNDFVVIAESIHPVPEPAVLGMFALGLMILLSAVGLRRRGHKKQ